MTHRYRASVAAAVLVMVLGGCGQLAQPTESTPSAQFHQYVSDRERASGQAAQDELLADGTASKQDYKAAVAQLERCLAQGDVTLVTRGWNPVHGQQMNLWFRNADLPDDEVAAWGDQCQSAHMTKIEQRYAKDHAPVMAPKLLTYARDCLARRDVVTTGKERNLPDLRRAGGAKREAQAHECVKRGAEKLYPEAPVVVS